MLVAFWGEYHGQLGTTTNSVAIATYMALNYKMNILVTHSQFTKSNMENAFFNKDEQQNILNFEDTGIDAIERLIKIGQLNAADIHNYSRTIVNERMDLLTGSTSPIRTPGESKQLGKIFEVAKEYYDLIFVDVSSGLKSEVTQEILKRSDLIVVNLNQNKTILKNFFADIYENFKDKEIIIVLGNYDELSKYTPKHVRRVFKYPREVFTVPHDAGLLDAFNDHDVLNFFLANLGDRSEESFLMYELHRISSFILHKSDIDEELVKAPITKGNLLSRTVQYLKKHIV